MKVTTDTTHATELTRTDVMVRGQLMYDYWAGSCSCGWAHKPLPWFEAYEIGQRHLNQEGTR